MSLTIFVTKIGAPTSHPGLLYHAQAQGDTFFDDDDQCRNLMYRTAQMRRIKSCLFSVVFQWQQYGALYSLRPQTCFAFLAFFGVFLTILAVLEGIGVISGSLPVDIWSTSGLYFEKNVLKSHYK